MIPQKYQALLAALKHKSITKAANELGYTQPNVSQMISSLEQELNVPLLVRTKKGVLPTIEARQLLPLMQQIVYMEKSLLESACRLRGSEIGCLRVGTLLSVST